MYARDLIAQMDSARIKQGVVLSTAYWFAGGRMKPVPGDELEHVRRENDWTVSEVGQFASRLVAFCSVNPLADYAVSELERCAHIRTVRGMKLHFANSGVDLTNTDHIAKLKLFLNSADNLRMALIIHLWTHREFGQHHAEIFLSSLLPAAPNVSIQIAHFAGGGPGYTDSALAVFAAAIRDGDPRVKNLYFDVSTVAYNQRRSVLETFARRIREVGVARVLFGTDIAPSLQQSWNTFAQSVPLTADELKAIASNTAPYVNAHKN
jgi:uncharacterized protein